MKIKGFNRVELVVREDEIEQAAKQFNEVLGTNLPKPISIENHPVLSSTDFDGSIEFVAPVNGEGPFAGRGVGQIGPLVWEIEDFESARTWLTEKGYRIAFEYDSTAGNEDEASHPVRQLVLDPEQWFGFHVTLMERGEPSRTAG
ncbi:MAG: VOC family protein [Myxococcota bacterium]